MCPVLGSRPANPHDWTLHRGSTRRFLTAPMIDTTQLLIDARQGDEAAFDSLFEHVYGELRRLARAQLRRRSGNTMQTTELVHEAYLRLFDDRRVSAADRVHFLSLAARAMRQILVEHFRARRADKRGGGAVHAEIDAIQVAALERGDTLLAIDDALEQLADRDARLGQVVEWKFFGGMTEPEIATALGVSVRTVSNDWRRARAWLTIALEDGGSVLST